MPKRARQDRYKEPLLGKKTIAARLCVSIKTVDRWIADGLTTRNVFGAVRCNPHDVSDWFRVTMDVTLPAEWWIES